MKTLLLVTLLSVPSFAHAGSHAGFGSSHYGRERNRQTVAQKPVKVTSKAGITPDEADERMVLAWARRNPQRAMAIYMSKRSN